MNSMIDRLPGLNGPVKRLLDSKPRRRVGRLLMTLNKLELLSWEECEEVDRQLEMFRIMKRKLWEKKKRYGSR